MLPIFFWLIAMMATVTIATAVKKLTLMLIQKISERKKVTKPLNVSKPIRVFFINAKKYYDTSNREYES